MDIDTTAVASIAYQLAAGACAFVAVTTKASNISFNWIIIYYSCLLQNGLRATHTNKYILSTGQLRRTMEANSHLCTPCTHISTARLRHLQM